MQTMRLSMTLTLSLLKHATRFSSKLLLCSIGLDSLCNANDANGSHSLMPPIQFGIYREKLSTEQLNTLYLFDMLH